MKLYEGLKVVEFTTNIAGPAIGQWMVEYGADVIHIEKPVVGDDSRHYPPSINGHSLQYYTFNHGKKSVTLDLKDPEGKKIACDIIKQSDVLLVSSRPGVMDKLGLGYEEMHELNPRLIYCSVSAWGTKGPYATRGGYDMTAQAASSMMFYNGDDETGPVKVYSEVGDYSAALTGFGAVNAALYYREKTGLGQHVDVSLVRSLAVMAAKLDDHRIFNKKTAKTGRGSYLLCPYGVYSCPDGSSISIAASNNNLTFKFFRLIGREDLTADPRFANNEVRIKNGHLMVPIMEEWLKTMGTAANAEKELVEAGIPCAKVYEFADVDSDPHYNEAGWFAEIPMPEDQMGIKARRIVGSPFTLSELSPEYKQLEGFGAANQKVLGELGYSNEEISALQEKWNKALSARQEV